MRVINKLISVFGVSLLNKNKEVYFSFVLALGLLLGFLIGLSNGFELSGNVFYRLKLLLGGLILISSFFNPFYLEMKQYIKPAMVFYCLLQFLFIYNSENSSAPVLELIVYCFSTFLLFNNKRQINIFLITIFLFSIALIFYKDLNSIQLLTHVLALMVCFSLLFILFNVLFEQFSLLELNNKMLTALYNHSDNFIVIVDRKTHQIIDYNTAFSRKFNLINRDNFIQQPILKFVRPTGDQTWEDYLNQSLFEVKKMDEFPLEIFGNIFITKVRLKKINPENKQYYLIVISDLTELVLSKKEAASNYEMLLSLLNLLPHQIFLKNTVGKFLITNSAFRKDFDLPEVISPNISDTDLISGDELKPLKNLEIKALDKNSLQSIYHSFTINGLKRNFYCLRTPFPLKDGSGIGILGVNIDVTETIQAREENLEKEKKYQLLIEQASDGIYLINEYGKILEVNDRLSEILGYSKQELLQMNIHQLVDQDHKKPSVIKISTIQDQTLLMERTFKRKNGTNVSVELGIRFINNDQQLCVVRDITERKELETILRKNEQKFRALIDNSPEMIILLDDKLEYLYISTTVKKILGYPENQFRQLTYHELIHPEDANAFKNFILDLRDKPNFRNELRDIRILNFEGSFRYIDVIGENKRTDPAVGAIILNFHDITDRKQQQLELLNRNFELDNFLYRTSHDMKSPLKSLLGLIYLTELESKNNPNIDPIVQQMKGTVDKMDYILNELSDFLQIHRDAIVISRINIEKITLDILNELTTLYKVNDLKIVKTFIINAYLNSDEITVKTILQNLISNAIIFRRNEKDDYISIQIVVNSDKLEIFIRDKGIGIDASQLDKIFHLFYRGSEKSVGAGMGLYIVKKAIEKLHGVIEVESILNEGTLVKVTLPNKVV